MDMFPLENGQMVVPDGTTLSTHCMDCGEPLRPEAIKPFPIRWVPIWVYLLFMMALVLALLAYAFASRRATLHLGFCETHLRSRLLGRRVQIASLAAVILAIFQTVYWAGGATNPGQGVSTLFLLTLCGGAFGYLWGRRKLQYPQILEVSKGEVRLEPGPGYVAREKALRGPSEPNPQFSKFLKE